MRWVRCLIGGLVLLACVACGSPDQHCAGVATCFGAKTAQCEKVPGCAATPGCVETPLSGVSCALIGDQTKCAGQVRCMWTGTACIDACSANPDQTLCEGSAGCLWSACTGSPKACATFSAAACPMSPLGCFLEQGPRLGD